MRTKIKIKNEREVETAQASQSNVTTLLREQLSKRHLKLTRQREIILDAFLKSDHITAEELYNQLSQEATHLGLATIYRTLNLLCEMGIGQQRHFGDQKTL